jgi:hypothetical protein
LRANGSRERAPDDRLCEAIHAMAVIASAAKQSMGQQKESWIESNEKKDGLLRRFAPRNDEKRHSFAISPRVSREF